MGYEILSDDLLASNGQAPDAQPDTWFQRLKDKIIWFKLHIFVIFIFLLGIYLFFTLDMNFDFDFSKDEEIGVLTLSGNFDSFNENYSGNLEIDSTMFSIKSDAISSNGESGKIVLKNFTGSITEINKTIVFNGTTQTFEFGKIKINTADKNFVLTSSGKTNTKLLLETALFSELDGVAKLDKSLNYAFENSTIKIENFQTTFAYDGTFTFSGIANKFEITSPNNNLKIFYEINLTNTNSTESKNSEE